MSTTIFAAATLALANFTSFDDAVDAFETCQAKAAYGLLDPAQRANCVKLYEGIKLEFVDPSLVAEYESIRNKPTLNTNDRARLHEIGLIGYAGWTQWKEDNHVLHRELVDTKMSEANAAYRSTMN